MQQQQVQIQKQKEQLLAKKQAELRQLQLEHGVVPQQDQYRRFPLRERQPKHQPPSTKLSSSSTSFSSSSSSSSKPLPAPSSYYRSGFGSNNSERSTNSVAIPTLTRVSNSAPVGTDNQYRKARTPAATRTQTPVQSQVRPGAGGEQTTD